MNNELLELRKRIGVGNERFSDDLLKRLIAAWQNGSLHPLDQLKKLSHGPYVTNRTSASTKITIKWRPHQTPSSKSGRN